MSCLGLAIAAVLIHGYHLGTDDAAIWVPAVKQAADPSLYPFGSEFFLNHAHLSLFPGLLGWFTRLTHLPCDAVLLICHFIGVFLLLLAGKMLLNSCFDSTGAQWAGVALLAGVLSVPVAGTALPIMDPYVTSRTLSTPLGLLALAAYLSGHRKLALMWLTACFLIHPQMSVYTAVLIASMEFTRRGAVVLVDSAREAPAFGMFAFLWLLPVGLPAGWELAPARGAAREALLSRAYFFVSNWTWYEWLGVAAPVVLLLYWSRAALRGVRPQLSGLLRSLTWFGASFTALGLLLASSSRFENYTRLQPMRAFHLLYVVFFLIVGAFAGEYVLKNQRWRWAALFGSLAAGMCLTARLAYPNSPHVEWPEAAPRGEWASALFWIRQNTPKDAVFALDPDYLQFSGEDMHGFRAVAERSVLADEVKDSGAVSLFPFLADTWDRQRKAQRGWRQFSLQDYRRLAAAYPVNWIVTEHRIAGLNCPFEEERLAVCQIQPPTPFVRNYPAH